MNTVAVGHHNLFQKCVTDPLVALVVLVVLGIFKILPLPVGRKVGRALGRFVGCFTLKRNRWGMINLHIAFPEKSEAQRRQILKNMWAHFGQLMAELPHLEKVVRKAKFEGLENLQKAYTNGKGGFVCSAHFGNWELPFAPYVAPDFTTNPVYRKANNYFLNKFLFERRPGVKIPKGAQGARLMIDLLKKGQFISILCDQKLREGMVIPFFGMPAYTATAMAGMAIKMQVPILMSKSVFLKGKYHLIFSKPLPIPQKKSKQEAEYALMLQVNQIYEQWIKANPEQWLWIHRRFDRSVYENKGILRKSK